jgi:hypothetical protein
VKASVRHQLEQESRKIEAWLEPLIGGKEPTKPGSPEFDGPRAQYELSRRTRAVTCGGLAATDARIHAAVRLHDMRICEVHV